MEFKTKAGNNYWSAFSKTTVPIEVVISELIDNSISASKESRPGVSIPATIELIFEELESKNIKLIISDDGTGVSHENLTGEENIFNMGYVAPNRGVLNEHGFGLKNALAALTNGFHTSFSFYSYPRDGEQIYKINGPIGETMNCEEVSIEEWNEDLIKNEGERGVKIVVEIPQNYWNSIHKQSSNFDTLCRRLGEEVGIRYCDLMKNHSHTINFHYKSITASEFKEQEVPPIEVPFLKSGSQIKVTEEEILLELDGQEYRINYKHGLLDREKVKDPNGPWPFPLKKHFQGSNARCGISLSVRNKIIRTDLFRELWPDYAGDVSYNNFLGKLELDVNFQTTNLKNDLFQKQPLVDLLYTELAENHPPQKTTKAKTEESLRTRIIRSVTATHRLEGPNRPKKNYATWSGGAEIDIYFEVRGKSHIYETKIDSAKILDLYQLKMYWDGLKHEGKEIGRATLVAKDFDHIQTALSVLNRMKDKTNKKYKFETQLLSEFDPEP